MVDGTQVVEHLDPPRLAGGGVVLRDHRPASTIQAAGFGATLAVVVRPLAARQKKHREVEGELTALGADIRIERSVVGEDWRDSAG